MSTENKKILKYQQKLEKYEKKIDSINLKIQERKNEISKPLVRDEKIKTTHRGVRDLVSGLTHCIGAGLSVAGLVLLIIFASIKGNAFHIVSFTIFGISLICMYLFSTLYHWLNISDRGIRVFRKLDHIMINFVIAASYTPICLTALRSTIGWPLFGVVWFFAILSSLIAALWINAPRWLTTSIYVLMGWIVIFTIKPLINAFAAQELLYSLWWLVAGGIFYTIGGIIYGIKRPKKKIWGFGFHEIFHIFIMLGSACHYWFIFYYILKFN